MQRLPFTALRSQLLSTPTISGSALRPHVTNQFFVYSKASASRSYGTAGLYQPRKGGLLEALRSQKMKWGLSSGVLMRGSRSMYTERPIVQQAPQFSWAKMGWTAAAVAGAVVAVEAVFNRDTRAPLSEAERSYLNSSFKYTGAGVVMTALAARAMFRSGVAFRIMAANPWVVLGVSLVGSIGTMMGTYYTPPERTFQKHALWIAFNACQAATLSPLFFFSPAILSRAALYTVGVVGSLSYIGATATNDRYLYMGGPLLAGVAVVALSSLAPMVLPMGMRALAITENISLYGGLAVFGGFVLYDTQKILKHAQLAERGLMKPDPINESISLELDMINIFIRLVSILARQQNNRK